MINISNLLLLGQIWRGVTDVQRNQTQSGMLQKSIRDIDRKIFDLSEKVKLKGGFKLYSLQKLVKMQLGSLLLISDFISGIG